MKCTRVVFDEVHAIVCGGRRLPACCKCRKPAGILCDWKIDSHHTCDKPLCEKCASSPAPGKHLCPHHAQRWEQMKAARAARPAADAPA